MAVREDKERKQISLESEDWERLANEADRRGLTMSKVVEYALKELGVLEWRDQKQS